MVESIFARALDFVIEKYPFLLLLAVVIIITWYFSKFWQSCKKCRAVNGNMEGKILTIHQEHAKEEESIKNSLRQINEKFNTLISILLEKEFIKDKSLFTTNSPLNLSEQGKTFIEKIGWKSVLDDENNRKILFDLLDKLNLKLKYDVEKYSVVILHELNGKRDENPFSPIKKYLYENSDTDEAKVIFACALYLRDEYLKTRPDIKE